MKTDNIALKLGNTLKEFLGFFKDDLQRKVLELDSNVLSKEYFQELTRVSNSLEQYVKKDISLFYVGFLGSYSSGKSSTINSLLNIWNTDIVRKVSNNPTDDCITLITNQENVSNVFTFAKEGAISVRTNTSFNIPFLKKIVIMDTPGSGDPNIIEGIVRDSLPLCDLIIYTLNATAPFTDIDKPFLVAQQSKLNNIPLIFLLTRADEYKARKLEAISDENFDNKRYTDDIKTIVSRINESLSLSNFTEQDFILIDNREKFNIDILEKKINEQTINGDENLIALHNHKLNYFRNEIKSIHTYYLNLSASKIDKCEKFLSKANDNIDYFDQQIELSKMKFRALWNENAQIFSRIYDGLVKGYIEGLFEELQKVKPISEYSSFIAYRLEIESKLRESAQQVSKHLLDKIEEKAFTELTNLKNKSIELVDFDALTIVDSKILFNDEFNYLFEFPLEKKTVIENFNNLCKQKMLDDVKIINDIYQRINRTVTQKKPLDAINDNIIAYKDKSLEILNLYYDAIKMYNVVAFSFEVKNYISELGLAKQFDELESGEINKTKYNLLAEKELLGNFKESSDIFESNLNVGIQNYDKLKDKLNTLDTSFSFLNDDLNICTDKSENFFKTHDISEFLTNSYRTLVTNIQNNLVELKYEIKKLKKRRLYRYLAFSILPLVIISLVWLCLKYKNIQTPTSFLWTIIIGISCSLVATLISSATDKYKNMRYNRIDLFKAKNIDKNEKFIIESFNEFKDINSSKKDEITQQILQKWKDEENLVMSELLKSPFSVIDTDVLKIRKDLLYLIDSYKNTYSKFNQEIIALFNNQEELFSKIDNVASKIKEDSIRPSFELLQKTIEEITVVRKEIATLDY